MACPKCGCKVHYQFNQNDVGPDDERMERCAACGAVFDIEDAADEDDEHEESSSTDGVTVPVDESFSGQTPMTGKFPAQ